MAVSITGGVDTPPLLVLLADGELRSGESLAEKLGQTRAAVWKGVERLRALGIGVQALARRGYRLSHPVELLKAPLILRELSAASRARLALATVDDRKDPQIYLLLMEIAEGDTASSGDARSELDALYSAAIAAYPSYFHYYSRRVNDLQERWYGRPGEAKAYVQSLLKNPGGDSGLVAYSYAANNLMQLNQRETLLRVTGLSWPTIKLAYATRERLYGMRNRDWNALCNLALAGEDRDAAKLALRHIGDNWDPAVWQERRYFDAAVAWINQASR